MAHIPAVPVARSWKEMAALQIAVFSDFSCPFSYVTEAALQRVTESTVVVGYRAWELFPAPVELAPLGLAEAEWQTVERLATRENIAFTRPDFRPRTGKAHEAARYAREHGLEAALRSAIFQGYWGDGRDIGRIDVLTELAAGVGLDAESLRIALDIDLHTAEVTADRELARRLQLPGTPVIYVGTGQDAQILAGAQEAQRLRAIIDTAVQRSPD